MQLPLAWELLFRGRGSKGLREKREDKKMKKTLLATIMGMALMAGAAMAQVRVGVGVGFGAPVAPGFAARGFVGPSRVVVAARPAMPGPGFVWIDGYRGPRGYVAGYWGRPPFAGAYWVGPRFVGGRFTAGYWGHPAGHFGAGFRGGFRG